ncbi:hypothetical protein [Nocardia sp. BMG111209]|uniref:hypothetical protein n=1 Tax=Nocardia sp. BMG111209 TaxID=1160137 RepID=UPI000379EECF|nr:hypothetical protein [Nocardia sp. BMG111209]
MSASGADARYRIEWFPGTDRLLGVCHCGATIIAEDPIETWQWLLGHPDGHRPPVLDPPGSVPAVAAV